MAKVTALKTPSKSKKPELEVSVSDEEPSESKDSDPDVWATKGILKEQTRKKNGKSVLYYLIEWEGDWYNSWEPAENVGCVLHIILHHNFQEESKLTVELDFRQLNFGRPRSSPKLLLIRNYQQLLLN